jgi:hypothetical protein
LILHLRVQIDPRMYPSCVRSHGRHADIPSAVVEKLSTFKSIKKENLPIILSKFSSLGLFSDEKVVPRGTIMRTLGELLERKMKFKDGEVDLVLLQHVFEVERKDGKKVGPVSARLWGLEIT